MKHTETVARRKLNPPEGFEFYRYECIGPDAVKLTGCVSSGVWAKGKRKGRPKYDGTPMVAVVTDAESISERHRYETETGNCGECLGTKQVFARWSVTEGTTYRECPDCKGSGVHSQARLAGAQEHAVTPSASEAP